MPCELDDIAEAYEPEYVYDDEVSAVIYESAVPTASMTGVDAVFPVLNVAVTEVPEDTVDATALFDSAVTIGTEAAVMDVPEDAVEVSSLDIAGLASEGAVTAVMTGVTGTL